MINSIRKFTDFILFNDMDDSNDIIEIKNNDFKPTKEFLSELTKLYSENYLKAMDKKKATTLADVGAMGGSGKIDEFILTDANDTSHGMTDNYYYDVVDFKNYSDIVRSGYFNINEKYFNYLAVIIGFSSLFRYSGVFKKGTKNYEIIHKMYHLLRSYPNFDTIENQNAYIDDYFRNAAIILIEVVKALYYHCVGKKITKRVCSISALSDLRETNNKKCETYKSGVSEDVQQMARTRSQTRAQERDGAKIDQFSLSSFPSLP